MRRHTILVMAVVLVALGVYVYLSSRPEPAPPPAPRLYVWSVEIEDLQRLVITLPPAGKRQAWGQHADRFWYFDTPERPKVNMKRWGGGIPLLLSGPGAERRITANATDAQLAVYGLNDPNMTIDLILKNGQSLSIEVGDRTPDGLAYYIRRTDARDIYTVHYSWHDVLERLVLAPPYAEPK